MTSDWCLMASFGVRFAIDAHEMRLEVESPTLCSYSGILLLTSLKSMELLDVDAAEREQFISLESFMNMVKDL